MITTAVESKTLAMLVYDPAAQILWLEFHNHAVYCYLGVPAPMHQALLEADSKGAYFNKHIRDRFPFRRVATRTPDSPAPKAR